MNQIRQGLHVWQQDAPVLFGEIKGKLLSGDTAVTFHSKSYSVVKDTDERGDLYVLMLQS